MELSLKMEEKQEEIKNIFNRVQHKNATELHIKRIPKDVKAKFIALADEQFVGDYGIALKFLVDGLINPDINIIYSQLDELNQRVNYLEQQIKNVESSKEENKSIKFLNGTKINKK